MPKSVREPIQVYLSSGERDTLDHIARRMGISRSEALRRGILALETDPAAAVPSGAQHPFVTGAPVGPGAPPPSLPVAPLDELLAELSEDREDV